MKVTKAVMTLREQLIEAVNASGLPPVVVELVVSELQTQLRQLSQEEYRKEIADEPTEATEPAAK